MRGRISQRTGWSDASLQVELHAGMALEFRNTEQNVAGSQWRTQLKLVHRIMVAGWSFKFLKSELLWSYSNLFIVISNEFQEEFIKSPLDGWTRLNKIANLFSSKEKYPNSPQDKSRTDRYACSCNTVAI